MHLVDGHASYVQFVVPIFWTMPQNNQTNNPYFWGAPVVTDTPGKRLRAERDRLGKSQRAFADLAEINKNTQLAYELGTSPIPLDYLSNVAAFGVDVAYVASGHRVHDDGRADYRGPPLETTDTVEVDEIDLRYGLGATYIDVPVAAQKRTFSRSWLRQFTHSSPEHLFWTAGNGDSMEPTIRSGEIVLIDSGQKTPRMSGGIWAVALGEVGMIKRLHVPSKNRLQLLSDNGREPPIEPVPDDDLQIIGRVVAVVRRL